MADAADRDRVLASLQKRIARYAARRVGDAAGEDVAQETVITLLEKYGHLDDADDLVPLAFRIAWLKSKAHGRKRRRRGEEDAVTPDDVVLRDDAPDPEEAVGRRALLARLKQEIARLGGRCRELFRHKLEGRSFADIQRLMGAKAINTVYTWDHRCRKALKDRLGGSWEVAL